MANLSRTEKYKELRDRLQHDNGSELSSRELSRFEKRLNHIDADNFAAPHEYQEEHEAAHSRKSDAQGSVLPAYKPKKEDAFDFNALFENNENDTSADSDFLDQYIREVKQYNIDQGNAVSENTSLNILKQMGSLPQKDIASQPLRPYPVNQPKAETKPIMPEENDTADIPFTKPSARPAQRPRPKPQESTDELPVLQPISADSTGTMTREDIMAEVQNLVNNAKPGHQPQPVKQEDDTRRQLLNETTQMRAQLDDYEDNLSEVNDKMQQTNRILHLVLIVLIAAMLVILGLVIYFIVLARGI